MIVLNGFVKIHRKLLQWGWYQDNVVKGVFIHLLITANFKDGLWQGKIIKAGQVIIGTKKMADELGFTRQQIRTAIKKLKSTNEITTEITNKFTVVTVVNWEDYQINEETPTNKITTSITNEQPTTNQQLTNKQPQRKKERSKEVKNNTYSCSKDADALFERVWELYPKKLGKGNVKKTQREKLFKIGYEELARAINRYISELQKNDTDIKYYKQGSTFFNSGYIDYLDENYVEIKNSNESEMTYE